MKIVVSNNYEGPIYEQIKRQIIQAILSDELAPGDTLPSLRSLAKELKVGVLTVNRAYTELENEGYLQTVQGRGCFVAEKSSETIKTHLLDEAKSLMDQALQKARKAGTTEEEICTLFQEQCRRIYHE
ncbi:GntR family transcriptional regulator [Blautia schinkii]|nr:GntR family transcriptional regulator [Blautia schinkii]